ncbi:hypothetical protein BJ912DRAFT_1065804 [Pholiota molesta]|nr:hypothetical protein BJ912DRAFT_1065804 [Pholiota molesta]
MNDHAVLMLRISDSVSASSLILDMRKLVVENYSQHQRPLGSHNKAEDVTITRPPSL